MNKPESLYMYGTGPATRSVVEGIPFRDDSFVWGFPAN